MSGVNFYPLDRPLNRLFSDDEGSFCFGDATCREDLFVPRNGVYACQAEHKNPSFGVVGVLKGSPVCCPLGGGELVLFFIILKGEFCGCFCEAEDSGEVLSEVVESLGEFLEFGCSIFFLKAG